MTRRTAKLAAVYLLLGLVATWAVAWGSAWLWGVSSSKREACLRVEDERVIEVWLRSGRAMRYAWRSIEDNNTAARLVELGLDPTDQSFRIADPPGWAMSLLDPDSVQEEWAAQHVLSGSIEARGWPFISLWSRVPSVFEYGAVRQAEGAIAIPSDAKHASMNVSERAILLPLLPYWPGLLADTLFYALLLAGLHQLAGWGRRARRRRRGRCVGCGYDLTGIDGVCPECWRGQPGQGATPAKGTDDV